jgi:MerR family transcriptional regulator, light-induced transcriptional regulator
MVSQQPERRRGADPADLAAEFALRFLSAFQRDDPTAMRHELEQATEACGLGACLDDVLLPGMRAIGTLWQNGQCGIEKERLATECARAWLQSHEVLVPAPDPGPPVVLACGPTDRHSLGLEALGILLRYQGQDCRMLGARVSTHTLMTAIRASRPAAVVIVSHLRVNRHRAAGSLRAAQEGGPELFYAGDAFATARLRRNLPGTYLGTRLSTASSLILRSTLRTGTAVSRGVARLPEPGPPPERPDRR